MWISAKGGTTVFAAGQSAWADAALAARQCSYFRPDDEDEWVADEPRSCYNCRYRRWTPQSFTCMKA